MNRDNFARQTGTFRELDAMRRPDSSILLEGAMTDRMPVKGEDDGIISSDISGDGRRQLFTAVHIKRALGMIEIPLDINDNQCSHASEDK